MIIFSGLCVAASLFVWTLPETIHSPLPDTIWVRYSSYRNIMVAQRGLRNGLIVRHKRESKWLQDAVKLHNPRKPCLSGEEPEEEEMEEMKEEN